MEKPMKIDDLGVPPFQNTSIWAKVSQHIPFFFYGDGSKTIQNLLYRIYHTYRGNKDRGWVKI